MNKIVLIKVFTAIFIIGTLTFAQNQLKENDVKSSLSKIFELSKNQNYSDAAKMFIYTKNNESRVFDYTNKSDARIVKRMAKKIKAYLDLSDSYEYESITYGTFKNLPNANLKVNFKSGDQELTISFLFVQKDGNSLLAEFK